MVVPWAIQVNQAWRGVFRDSSSAPLLSLSGPSGFCLVNGVELIALQTSPRGARRLDIYNLIVEGDSFCVIKWASVATMPLGLGGY